MQGHRPDRARGPLLFPQADRVGAVGYVLKRSVSEDLLRAIHSVAAGGPYLDPAIAGKAFDGIAADRAGRRPVGDLSEREIEILRLTARRPQQQGIANLAEAQRQERRDLQGAGWKSWASTAACNWWATR